MIGPLLQYETYIGIIPQKKKPGNSTSEAVD
jgi:hypothetical protein